MNNLLLNSIDFFGWLRLRGLWSTTTASSREAQDEFQFIAEILLDALKVFKCEKRESPIGLIVSCGFMPEDKIMMVNTKIMGRICAVCRQLPPLKMDFHHKGTKDTKE